MQGDEEDDNTVYKVVMNHEEQYSIWPADRENPLGWSDVGTKGSKAECLAYIEEVWTDMRPLSLRKHMEEMARSPRPEPDPKDRLDDGEEDDLVQRLASGPHPVEIRLRPERTVTLFQEAINRGYVYLKFTETRGGTELGVRIEQDKSDLSRANFADQTGTAHLVGGLTLNFVKVRCVADIELGTLAGKGHLEIVQE
jgi:uncharacterized protein YbdZ (MbtH family)